MKPKKPKRLGKQRVRAEASHKVRYSFLPQDFAETKIGGKTLQMIRENLITLEIVYSGDRR